MLRLTKGRIQGSQAIDCHGSINELIYAIIYGQSPIEDFDTLELNTSPMVGGGTGEPAERPLPAESTFAAARRIDKHAVAVLSIGVKTLDTWICVSTALAAEAWSLLWNRLFLQVITRGPIMHEKCLWRFYPVVVSLVYQNKGGGNRERDGV